MPLLTRIRDDEMFFEIEDAGVLRAAAGELGAKDPQPTSIAPATAAGPGIRRGKDFEAPPELPFDFDAELLAASNALAGELGVLPFMDSDLSDASFNDGELDAGMLAPIAPEIDPLFTAGETDLTGLGAALGPTPAPAPAPTPTGGGGGAGGGGGGGAGGGGGGGGIAVCNEAEVGINPLCPG